MTFSFYIKFGYHSFNCNVFGLESFYELIFFNLIPWYLIFISNLILIFLIVMFSFSYHFLNWNWFFVSNLILVLFKSIFFSFLFFSSLSPVILIGWESYVVIFSDKRFILMISVINSESWTGLASIIFYFFISSMIIRFIKN